MRPPVAVERPAKITIRDGIVRCNYQRGACTYTAGPYLNRDDAAQAAQTHWATHHRRRS